MARLVCLALQRPSIFSYELVDMRSAAGVSLRTLHMDLALRRKLQNCLERECIQDCNCVSFVNENLSSSEASDILWLNLYLAIQYSTIQASTAHDQLKSRWTKEILRAAMSRINTLFVSQRCGRILSIWLSTIDVFTAGTVILDISLRRPTINAVVGLNQEQIKALRKASSLLAGFSELWEGAKAYRDVFDVISDRVFAQDMIQP